MKKVLILILMALMLVACGGNNGPAEWLSVPLTDVQSGETFTLADFAGKVVIVESMAVWCPQCTTQQQMISAAVSELDGDIVVVSVNIDSNEDEAIVRQHAELMGWDWRFVIASTEMAEMLQADFGPTILTPTATPVVIIAPDGTATLTPNGIKGWDMLIELVEEVRG